MKNRTLLRTNLLVCMIIIIGFTSTSIISYQSNFNIYRKDTEQVSTLAFEGIYSQINDIFSHPVNVSLTIANDSLLKKLLMEEKDNLTNPDYLWEMQNYLSTYQKKYSYDSVFLVSTATNRYYHFNGIDRVLTPENPENTWYYSFLDNDKEYSLNVDNDEATSNHITVFVNCKIRDTDGTVLGIVGAGIQVNSLQQLLMNYEEKYNVSVCLIDHNGNIQISSTRTGYDGENLFDTADYFDYKDAILEQQATRQDFWYASDTGSGYLVSRYEPNLNWYLLLENDTSTLSKHLNQQLYKGISIIIFIILLVLITITTVFRKYNTQIVKLTVSQELEYQRLLHETTEGLYENIFEFDITRNRAGGESTKQYFKSLGLSDNAAYDQVLYTIADKQIKPEYVQGYLNTFLPDHVLKSYSNGITNLNYDFMLSNDGINYRWMRIIAQVFFWNSDKSVRMIAYRKNIDAEKKREFMLLDGIQRDSMTGLYNKRATEELVAAVLKNEGGGEEKHAFLIFDIDNFKAVNDTMGHNFGDHAIHELAAEIKAQFQEFDIVGRIGGDEFAVLMTNIESLDSLQQKLERLCKKLEHKDVGVGDVYHISCSIGVALFQKDGNTYAQLYEKADQALYYAKGHGKSSFSIYGKDSNHQSYHLSERDMAVLVNYATDGIAKFAVTEPLTLLYFNQKFAQLIGFPPKILSSQAYDPMDQVHPDDREALLMLKTAALNKKLFCTQFRIRHYDGHYFPVSIKGLFISDLYENQYPIFYIMYHMI